MSFDKILHKLVNRGGIEDNADNSNSGETFFVFVTPVPRFLQLY